MSRRVRLIVAAMAMVFGVLSLPGATTAQEFEPVNDSPANDITANQDVPVVPGFATGCEEMDHSILRLYFAYFLRIPNQEGFDFWQGKYGNIGNPNFDVNDTWSLPRISEFFATSSEFQATYGTLSNQEFVELIYANILRRTPDAGGLTFWTSELNRGVRRGTVMLGFSESAELVAGNDVVPQTIKPMSGHGRWYPSEISWICGSGNQTYSVGRDFQFADVTMWNNSGGAQNVSVQGLGSSGEVLFSLPQQPLENNFIRWSFDNSAIGWREVRFATANNVVSTLVLYDEAPPANRPGW